MAPRLSQSGNQQIVCKTATTINNNDTQTWARAKIKGPWNSSLTKKAIVKRLYWLWYNILVLVVVVTERKFYNKLGMGVLLDKSAYFASCKRWTKVSSWWQINVRFYHGPFCEAEGPWLTCCNSGHNGPTRAKQENRSSSVIGWQNRGQVARL